MVHTLGPGQPALEMVGDYRYRFPELLTTPDKLQKYLDRCPPNLTVLQISASIQSIVGVRFPVNLIEINLSHNHITTLVGVQFPPNLTKLNLSLNRIESLHGVQFPQTLTTLDLCCNFIQDLDRIQFPPNLTELLLEDNKISHMTGVQFPSGLTNLNLSNSDSRGDDRWGGYNQIKSFNDVKFPPSLTVLNLERNRLQMIGSIIDPTPNILHLIELQFPKIVEEYRKNLARQSQQSQQADSKFTSESAQKSTITMLKTLTAFFREGMEARARQHEEQVKKENEERGRQIFFVRGPTGKTYPVPLNTTMTIQAVLDYLNSHYYISALEDCGVMHLIFSKQRLEPERTLADYNVQAESTLNLVCKFRPNLFQGGSKKRRLKKSKQRPKKQRNKSNKNRT